jgi:large subunit ribosomal protein L10
VSVIKAISRAKKIPEWKEKLAREIRELATKYPVFLVLDLTDVPAKHLQMLRKKLDRVAVMKVVKPKVALKALESIGLSREQLEPYMTGQVMLLFTNMNVFEIADIVRDFITKDYYRPGEAVDKEIVIPEGNTGIPAGPMLSVFSRLKIPTKVQANVIYVAKDTVVAKPGDKVSADLASLLQKLGLALKEIKLKIKCGRDGHLIIPADKLVLNVAEYEELLKRAALDGFKLAVELVIPEPNVLNVVISRAHRKALVLASEAGFITPETAAYVLRTAHMRALALAAEIAKYAPELGLEVKPLTTQIQKQEERPRKEEKEEEKKEEEKGLSEEALAEGFAALFG